MEGHYEIDVQTGHLDGRLHGNFFTFSFEGMAKMDEVHGEGEGILNGAHLTFQLGYFRGDE